MAFEVFSNEGARPKGMAYVTTDKQGRIYINRLAQKNMGISQIPVELYVAYDKVNKRIGLAKPEVVRLTDIHAFTFSGKRAYASAISFLKKNGIMPSRKAQRYFYDGREDGWYTFKLEEYDAPDDAYLPREEDDIPKGQTNIDDHSEERGEILVKKPDLSTFTEGEKNAINTYYVFPSLSQRELAKKCDISKATVSNALKKARELGYIE